MYYIGVDLGGTNIAAGLVNESYEIVKKASVPTGADRDAIAIVEDMAKVCNTLLEEANLTADDVAYIGIASPGIANSDTGVVEYANNLPFRNFPIAEELKKLVPVKKVLIENDANAAAKGEAVAGCAKGVANSVMITLGTGVGGGIIIDNKVYSGFNHAGAELGHIVIVHDGVPCSCGRKGCWEAYSSATALIRMTKEKIAECNNKTAMYDIVEGNLDNVNGRTAFDAARQGDKAGQEVVDTYISYLATGIANIVNIFQPEVLSIGGGISNERDNLLIPLREKVEREQYSREGTPKPELRIATLRNDAGIIGAAVLGL